MYIARVAAVIFAIMNLVGLVWFSDAIRPSVLFFGIAAIICALIVSLAPRRLINNASIRWMLIVLCMIGIGAIFALIAKDFQRTYGPDFGAIIMRLLFVFTFVYMGLDIYRSKCSPDETQ